MKKLLLLSALFLFTISTNAQKPAYKKNIVAGAAMTGIGDATLVAGLTCLLIGIDYNSVPDLSLNYTDYTGDNLIITGSVLMGVGAALTIAGPIILVKGIKQKKASDVTPKSKKEKYMSFVPIKNSQFDNYNTTFNREKIASLTFTF